MHAYKKILLASLLISAPLFAFSLDSKLDQMTDKVSNSLFDKAADGVTNTIDGKSSSTSKSKMEQIKELAEMKKQGLITKNEFKQQKRIILNKK